MTKYFSFSGKAKRQEYWAVTFLTFFLGWLVYGSSLIIAGLVAMLHEMTGGLLVLIFTLGWIVSSAWLIVATTVRRCNDADISPLWSALWILPFANFWWWIICGVLPPVDKNFIPDAKT